ncbi:MAG: MarR family transcriptional regulator [Bacteroidales bacterium]|jgi:DNA-binding MarR family transcriptional regulator|nr:MarR family transcriptional regulator [Bacteroidales bacterium]MDD2280907.1 MarR family transcriptional regulator [Bacteroidales bacterium]MDD4292785.1 MarR family transcriptional regulator [Bacteroidales bacterium]MDD4491309.1 MarR family transcriptional regulator [Bacteroidales bacterium]NTU94969.1 MarR family transcriptional regulator [Bacteroidales bacterium]
MQLIELVKINELLSILSGRLSATLNRHLNRKFKAAGLEITTEQWLVLVCLWNKDKLTQQAISEQTFKDKASITRLLDTLSRHDLIERHSEPSDRRINLIHLTEKGKKLEEQAMAIVKESFEQAITGITPQELLFSREIIIKLLNNII